MRVSDSRWNFPRWRPRQHSANALEDGRLRGLSGKTAIVTGGAHGIGRACVERLSESGVSVVFSDVDSVQGGKTQSELRSAGGDVTFVDCDMRDEISCRALRDSALERHGAIEILINNAFSFIAAGLTATRDQWRKTLEIGLFGYATMIQLVSEPMRKSGGGSIVNVSSVSAHVAQPNRWTYNCAKGAVNQLTRCAALDLAPHSTRVNSVSPGWIWTREVAKAAQGDTEKYRQAWGKFHMLRRCGTADEVASACLFLCSDEASFITGSDLPVDGGYLAMGPEGIGENTVFAGSD